MLTTGVHAVDLHFGLVVAKYCHFCLFTLFIDRRSMLAIKGQLAPTAIVAWLLLEA